MALNNRTARPGSQFTLDGTTFTVHNVSAPGTGGRSFSAGPIIDAWVRPGGYGVTIDETTAGVEWIDSAASQETLDVAAGIEKAKSLGYTEANDQMVVEAALYRLKRGNERSAKNLWLSKFPFELAAWNTILAAANTPSTSPAGDSTESGVN